jgi:hypothetical protein
VLALPEVDEGGDHGDEEDGRDQVFGHGIDPFGAPRYAFTSEPYVWLINGMFHASYDGRPLCPADQLIQALTARANRVSRPL